MSPSYVEPVSTGVHIAFYRFISIADVATACARLEELARDLTGTILVATEGVNGMLAGTPEQIDDFLESLRNTVLKLQRLTAVAV